MNDIDYFANDVMENQRSDMQFESTMKDYHCKDHGFKCPSCGFRLYAKNSIDEGEPNMDYAEMVNPSDFNPFNGNRSDRISIPYDCRCHKCGERFRIYLVCRCIGADVFSDDGKETYIDSFDTEGVE